jgi:fatty acid CoA ligase FadD9
MSIDPRERRLERRISEMYAMDRQFADARPSDRIRRAIESPGMGLSSIVQTILDGYADRPALGQRALRFVTDPSTGRTSTELLPQFDTITYRELSDEVDTVAAALTGNPVRPGHRVAMLGVTSTDYTIVDMALLRLGATAVPLQSGAPLSQLRAIAGETEPVMIASSVDFLDDAVELALSGHRPERLVVFDYHGEVDDHREALTAATTRVAGTRIAVETLFDVLARGNALPTPPWVESDDDALALLIYTSGSTGAPKGAMYTVNSVADPWRQSNMSAVSSGGTSPEITLNYLPMSHVLGRGILYITLGAGGTAYFAATNDLSTFFDDLSLVRPTKLSFVPRIWDMLFQQFQSEVDRRSVDGDDDRRSVEADVLHAMRTKLLGGRFLSAVTSSAPISSEMRTFVEALVDMRLTDGYGSTEAGPIFVNGRVQRPPVIDYKLLDVPELGYFRTDRPHPRGELLIKSETMFPGYYKRQELTAEVFDVDGYYRTGDVVAEVGRDQLVYLDRRNDVLKLSQGEFVAVSKLEAVFGDSPVVRQIFV